MGNLDYPKLFVVDLHTREALASINGKMKCKIQDFLVADKKGGRNEQEMRQKEEFMIVLLCISPIVVGKKKNSFRAHSALLAFDWSQEEKQILQE